MRSRLNGEQMITVTNPSKPFQYTAKGTPRRHVCLKDYTDEIEEVYHKIEESSQVNVATPEVWTDDGVLEYVRKVVQTVMKAPQLGDHDDLFQQGGDRCAQHPKNGDGPMLTYHNR